MSRSIRLARPLPIFALALCVVATTVGLATATRLTIASGVYIAPGEAGAATSACPAGKEARQGGFYGDLRPGSAELTGFKMRGRGWRALATNPGTMKAGLTVESYCSRAAPHRLIQRSATVTVPARSTAAAVARCRPGETLLSAGFRSSIEAGGPHVVVDGMRRVGVRNLRVTGANLAARSDGRLTAYAYCGRAKRPLVRTQTATVPASGKVRLVAKCPEKVRGFGHRPELFGGFQASSSDPASGSVASPAQFRSFGDRGVITAVNRSPGDAIEVTAFAYCR